MGPDSKSGTEQAPTQDESEVSQVDDANSQRLLIQKLTEETFNLRLDRERKERERRRWWLRPEVVAIGVSIISVSVTVIFNIISSDLKVERARLEADKAAFELQKTTAKLEQVQTDMSVIEGRYDSISGVLARAEKELYDTQSDLEKQINELGRITGIVRDMRSIIMELPNSELKKRLMEEVIAVTGRGMSPLPSRSTTEQRDFTFGDGTSRWSVEFDIKVGFSGQGPITQPIGSFSTQPFSGAKSFVALARWTDLETPDTWDAGAVWTEASGNSLTETIPGDGFRRLLVNHQYRWRWEFDLDTGTILNVSIIDVENQREVSYEPTDRYLGGGKNSKWSAPTAYRVFAGGFTPGNIIEVKNVVVEPIEQGGTSAPSR